MTLGATDGLRAHRRDWIGLTVLALPAAAAITARGTLAGAAVVTGELPGPVGASVLAAGRSAFTAGLHGVGYTAAGLLLVAAAVCPALLRRQLVHPEM